MYTKVQTISVAIISMSASLISSAAAQTDFGREHFLAGKLNRSCHLSFIAITMDLMKTKLLLIIIEDLVIRR